METDTESGASGPTRSWPAVGTVAGWQVVASICYYATFAATAGIKAEFGLSRFQVGIVIATLTLGYTLFLFPAGALVDAFGDRPAMVGGLLGLGLGALGVAAAPTNGFLVLLGAVFVLGAAYSGAMPSTNRAVADRAPRGRYNLSVGLKQVGVTAGSAVAALLVTGFAAIGFSWRAGFVAAALCSFAVAVGFALRYRGTGGSGELTIPEVSLLVQNRSLRRLVAVGFFLGASVFTATGYVVPYLDESVGFSVGVAGLVLALMQVTGSAGRIVAGSLADRLPWGSASASLAVLGGQAVGAAVLLWLLPLFEGVAVYVAFAALGVVVLGGTGLYHGALVVIAADERSGAATAAGQTTINLGGLVVPPVFGLVADHGGYEAAWPVLGACMAAAFLLTVFVRRTV
ncbi:MFS transporter [Halospeciosus flavus]|uniref:MFS transporter n=1 Tax=Halospeciosus flavus TaxID=3032283 RepID=A0ABD5Z466_9EURY|nr:MFS transporter [Halospeciosus flavus]